MVEWMKSKKHVFWEALLVTVAVFSFGILLGVSLEKSRMDLVERYYSQSEISLLDIIALDKLSSIEKADCDSLVKSNNKLADRIYQEALVLEEYDSSNRITNDLKLAHKKYDLLRAFVWMNSLEIYEKCENASIPVVYLYEYNTDDLQKKAEQIVWSRILGDFKESKGSEIVLIPLAVDNELASVDSLVSQYSIEKFPCVIIEDEVVYEVKSVAEIEKYLG